MAVSTWQGVKLGSEQGGDFEFHRIPRPPAIRLGNTSLTKCTVKETSIDLHAVVAAYDWDPVAQKHKSRQRAGVKHVRPCGFRGNQGSIQVDIVT